VFSFYLSSSSAVGLCLIVCRV